MIVTPHKYFNQFTKKICHDIVLIRFYKKVVTFIRISLRYLINFIKLHVLLHQIKVTNAFGKNDTWHLWWDQVSMQHTDRSPCTLTPGLQNILRRILHLPPPPLLNGLQGNPHSFSQHPPVSTYKTQQKGDNSFGIKNLIIPSTK